MNNKKTLLVVEDSNPIREALVRKLTLEGYEVLEAQNGLAGITAALAEKPDLILLDMMMPIADGNEFLDKLRQDAWGKQAKVIVLSNDDAYKDVVSALKHNVSYYFIKANTPLSEIVTEIRHLLDEK